jgi:glycosyltransferase involved in cell wall biosynthesis
VELLLQAWTRVSPDFPRTELWLAGEGPDRGELQDLAEKLGVSMSVRFLGHKRPEELRPLYRQAELLVLPSRHEGLPMVLLEAGASGTICVGTKVVGVTEAIEDGATGFLVEPESPDALARAIASALELPAEERLRMREAAQTRIRKSFTQKAMVSSYLGLFRSLLDQDS